MPAAAAIDVEKPVEQIPVFVKGGTLLPVAEPVEYVAPTTEFALTVRVYGANPQPFVLYEDDGVTLDFEKGVQNRVTLSWNGSVGHGEQERRTTPAPAATRSWAGRGWGNEGAEPDGTYGTHGTYKSYWPHRSHRLPTTSRAAWRRPRARAA